MKKRDQDSQEPASTDPAAVIAQALRRKFAHNVFQDSPGTCIIMYIHALCTLSKYFLTSDKENLLDKSSDTSASGFDSPAGKLVNDYNWIFKYRILVILIVVDYALYTTIVQQA